MISDPSHDIIQSAGSPDPHISPNRAGTSATSNNHRAMSTFGENNAAAESPHNQRLLMEESSFITSPLESTGSPSFVRSYNVLDSSPSKLSRISLAIRRSLKLTSPKRAEPSPQEVLEQEKQLPPFNEYTDLIPEVFTQPQYGTTETLNRLLSSKHIRQLKYFLRENDWPTTHEIRRDLWRALIQLEDREFDSSKNFYNEQYERLFRGKVQNYRPAFLSEPGIVVCAYGLKENGVVDLQRLLMVVEYAKPEIRFVPVLYPIAALLLHYHSAVDTYACVIRLLSQGNRFILQSELAVFAYRYTLLALLKKFKRTIFNKLKSRMGMDEERMADVMTHWQSWIFKYLPLPYLVRVLDCFFIEGHKMLARVTLTILYLWHRREKPQTTTINPKPSPTKTILSRSSTCSDELINNITGEIALVALYVPVSVQTFLDIGFSIRRFSNNYLYRKQQHYETKCRNRVWKRRAAKKAARRIEERIYTQAFESKIVDEEVARELMTALPARFQLDTPGLLFRLSEHGTSFVQFWTMIEEADQSLLIIRTTDNRCFGAYLSSSWMERRDIHERTKTRYFGTGESFVWRLDEELKLPVFYRWYEQNCDNFFMAAYDKCLLIGSGGGDAIAIRDELVEGYSSPSTTFQSPELVAGGQFQIAELEVFGIASVS